MMLAGSGTWAAVAAVFALSLNAFSLGSVPLSTPVATTVAEAAPAVAAAELEPQWRPRVTLYHAGGGGAGPRDSLGCRPVPMRTIATDPNLIPRRSVVYIRETDGLRLPDGTVHDGVWYASDTGGAIRGGKIDLYTGHGRASMQPVMQLNTRNVSVVRIGSFRGCPPADA